VTAAPTTPDFLEAQQERKRERTLRRLASASAEAGPEEAAKTVKPAPVPAVVVVSEGAAAAAAADASLANAAGNRAVRTWSPRGLCRIARRASFILVRFLFHPMNIIDFLSVAAFYIGLSFGDNPAIETGSDSESSRYAVTALRLARVLRLVKVGRRSDSLLVLGRTFYGSLEPLGFLLLFIILGSVLSGSLLYICEMGDWQAAAKAFWRRDPTSGESALTPYQSVPHGIWSAEVTEATVGYGDTSPITIAGRIIGSFVLLSGTIVVGLPISVIGPYLMHWAI
jgi:hypothetical protein